MKTFRQMLWVISGAFWFFLPFRAEAQTLTWDDFLDRITDKESENYTALYDFYEDLLYLHEHPININSISTEVLQQLPFLNAQQIKEIETYVISYGPIRSVGELELIPYLDYYTRQLLALFITFGEKEKKVQDKLSFNKLLKYGKQEIMLRTDVPFYAQDEKYIGSPLYHSLRYRYKYGQRVEWGLTAKKDKGEPFFQGVDNGFDSYNYYLVIKNLGMLKTLALGDYRLKFGQGLVLNSQFSLGKMAMLSQLNGNTTAITKHSSVSETGYFQGMAAQFAWEKLQLYTFCSYRFQDATLTADSLISSLKTDGYHRTISEINKKNNITNTLIGTHLEWNKNDFHIGLTSTWTVFNRRFITYPSSTHYKHYYPQGTSFFNNSVDYSYISYKLTVKGETAIDGTGALATLNSIQYRPSSIFQFNMVQRYYDKRYNSIFGQAFGESSQVKNENGIYVGVVYKPISQLKTLAYIDLFEFPWYRYLVSSQHSKGLDALGQMEYSTDKNVELLVKYRVKVKQQNFKNPQNEKQVALANRIIQTFRLQGKYNIRALQLKSQFDYTQYNVAAFSAERGFAFSQQALLQWKKPALQWSVSGVYFHTDSYESRIYSYERGLLYSFSFPSYNGHGLRLSTVVRLDLAKTWMLMLKYGHTQYLDKSKPMKDDLQIQLRFKF